MGHSVTMSTHTGSSLSSGWRWAAAVVAAISLSATVACTPTEMQELSGLFPVDPSVSFAVHGDRDIPPAARLAESVVFPVVPGQEYPRIPIMLRANNGDLVAIAAIRQGSISDGAARQPLRAAISSDGGVTWNYHEITTAGATDGDAAGVVDPSTGRIHVLSTTNHYVSDDNGVTWSNAPYSIDPNAAGVTGFPNGPGAGIALSHGAHAGRLVVMCRKANPDSFPLPPAFLDWSHTTNCVLISDDGGETWTTSQTVQTQVGEGAVVELADGTLYMSSRTYLFDGHRSEAYSTDGGQTWDRFGRSVLPEPYFGVNGSLTRVEGRADGSNLVLYSNIPEYDPPLGVVSLARKNLSLYWSDDETGTWHFGGVIHRGPSAYSSMVAIGSDVGVLYEAVIQDINSDRGPADPPDGIRFVRVDTNALDTTG